MTIDAVREEGSAVLRLSGRLDREWAEHLSNTLEDLLQDGVRSLLLDFSRVTYVSSAATNVLGRWQQELAVLRGDLRLASVPAAVQEMFGIAGWDGDFEPTSARRSALRRSAWYSGASLATRGHFQMSESVVGGTLSCRLHGQPNLLAQPNVRPDASDVVGLRAGSFTFGLGAIGGDQADGLERLGELVAVSGCVAYFPTDGARLADYLIADGALPPRAVLASGMTCEGAFSTLVRFNPKSGTDAVPLSELADVALEAVGGAAAGLVVAAETAGLAGARLRRSPARAPASPVPFEVPALREWLLFAPERTYSVTTALIAGVVARAPTGPLAAHLRPLGWGGELAGHFHAAVFSYQPLPQRTVELDLLLRGLFTNHQLRDVLHLVWDDRGEAGVAESALVRGVAWAAPITQVI